MTKRIILSVFVAIWIAFFALMAMGCGENANNVLQSSNSNTTSKSVSEFYTVSFEVAQKYNIMRGDADRFDNSLYIVILDTSVTFYELESWADVNFATLPEQYKEYSTTGWTVKCKANWGDNSLPSSLFWNVGFAGWWHEYNISFISNESYEYSIIINTMSCQTKYSGQFGVLEVN